MFRSYTLTKEGLSDGIKTDLFECLVHDIGEDVAVCVEVSMLPILPYAADMQLSAQLSLGFMKACSTDPDKIRAGAVLAVDATSWRLCTATNELVYLDTSTDGSMILLFVPASSVNALISIDNSGRVLSTDSYGVPSIRETSRAELMLSAIHVDVRRAFSGAAPDRRLAGAALVPDNHRKPRRAKGRHSEA